MDTVLCGNYNEVLFIVFITAVLVMRSYLLFSSNFFLYLWKKLFSLICICYNVAIFLYLLLAHSLVF